MYREFQQFLGKYFGINHSVTQTAVDPVDFKHLFPLIVFDVSRQSEKIASAVVDITLQCFFHSNVAANTKAYCLLISDRRLKFKSDGTKANLVYQIKIHPSNNVSLYYSEWKKLQGEHRFCS